MQLEVYHDPPEDQPVLKPCRGSRPRRVRRIEEYEIDGEIVLYDPQRNRTHVLNATSAVAWRLCAGTRDFEQLVDDMSILFDMDSAVIALDCAGDDDDDDVDAVPGDIPVSSGQSVNVECDDDDCEVEFDEGTLNVEASGATLVVTATDECGNTATCTVELCVGEEDD